MATPAYTIWRYLRPKPGTNPRRRWRGDCEMIHEWAWAPRSKCGEYFETSNPRGGFASEAEAKAAAERATGTEGE